MAAQRVAVAQQLTATAGELGARIDELQVRVCVCVCVGCGVGVSVLGGPAGALAAHACVWPGPTTQMWVSWSRSVPALLP